MKCLRAIKKLVRNQLNLLHITKKVFTF